MARTLSIRGIIKFVASRRGESAIVYAQGRGVLLHVARVLGPRRMEEARRLASDLNACIMGGDIPEDWVMRRAKANGLKRPMTTDELRDPDKWKQRYRDNGEPVPGEDSKSRHDGSCGGPASCTVCAVGDSGDEDNGLAVDWRGF